MPAVRAAREDTFGVELRGPADAPAPAAIRLSSVDDGRTFYRGQAPLTPLGIVDDQAIGRATIIDREVRQRSDFFEVRALDAAGLDSRPFGVRLSPPAVVELGEACDPAGAWSRCADGLRCPDAAHGEPYVCEAPDDRCPADWTVHDVNPHPQGDRWVVFGERRDDDLAGLSSACAPPAPVARIYRFVAPRAGAWQITARNASLVDVRRSCAAPAPICWRADGDAPAVVELSAGEAIHLVLTPPYGDALGAHILTVEPL